MVLGFRAYPCNLNAVRLEKANYAEARAEDKNLCVEIDKRQDFRRFWDLGVQGLGVLGFWDLGVQGLGCEGLGWKGLRFKGSGLRV